MTTQAKIERERRVRAAAEQREYEARRRAQRPVPAQSQRRSWVDETGAAAWEAALQADTAMRTAANTLTFGYADSLAAGLESLRQTGDLSRKDAILADYRNRNRYDATHRREARLVGEVGAAALPFAGAGIGAAVRAAPEVAVVVRAAPRAVAGAARAAPRAVGGATKIAPRTASVAKSARLPGAASLSKREAGALVTAGGLTDVAIQHAADAATGQRPSWRNDVGAFAGGAAGTLAMPFLGARAAGAVNGAVTSSAQDLLNGRSVSLEEMAQGAALGRLFGGAASDVGAVGANALSSQSKGRLGEALGSIRSTINGMPIEAGPKKLDLDSPRRWYPDGVSGDVRFEYKFGPTARLSKGQRAAQAHYGSNFRLYHFLPEDVGNLFAVPMVGLGGGFTDDQTK